MTASLLDPALLELAVQASLEQNPMFDKTAYVPPGGGADPAQGGAPPPGMDPAAMGGAPPGAPPGMDPAAAGGMPPPPAPAPPPPMGAPPTALDPTGMAGMMPPQQPMAGGGGGEQKKKLDPAMLDARLFTIQQLLIGLYEAQGIPLPAKAMMGNIPDPQSQMVADQQFAQQDQQASAAAAAAPGGAPTGAPPGGAPMDPAAAAGLPPGGGAPMDPMAGMPPKMAEVVTRNKTAAADEPLPLGTPLGNQEVPAEAAGGLMSALFDEAAIMAEMQQQFGIKTAGTQPVPPPAKPATQLDLMSWLEQQTDKGPR